MERLRWEGWAKECGERLALHGMKMSDKETDGQKIFHVRKRDAGSKERAGVECRGKDTG